MEFDLRGINIDKIPSIQAKIADYIKEVNKITNKITADAGEVSYTAGLKGQDQVKAIETYINDAVSKIHTVTDKLNKFSEALDQVKQNYISQDTTVASSMGSINTADIKAKSGVSGFSD